MEPHSPHPVAANAGGPPGRSAESLLPIVYEELRAAAARLMSNERAGHTLQRTALVHEAYARLAKGDRTFESELHFFNAAAMAMRRILVDHASARGAQKRGGKDRNRVDLDNVDMPVPNSAEGADDPDVDWSALDRALNKLEKVAPRRAQVVMLKFFAGLSDAQIGKLLGVSETPIRRDWATARLWLYEQMSGGTSSPPTDGHER